MLAVFADVTSHRTDSRSTDRKGPKSAASALLRAVLRGAPETAGEETDLGHEVSADALLSAIGARWNDAD